MKRSDKLRQEIEPPQEGISARHRRNQEIRTCLVALQSPGISSDPIPEKNFLRTPVRYPEPAGGQLPSGREERGTDTNSPEEAR